MRSLSKEVVERLKEKDRAFVGVADDWSASLDDVVVTINEVLRAREPEPMEGVPEHLRDGIRRYVHYGVKPGGFLSAVFSGDLFEAVSRADDTSRKALVDICRYIVMYCPITCYGDREKVVKWCKKGGLEAYNPSRTQASEEV